MKLGGDENKIQALFCELSLEDQSYTPRFENLWNRAEATRPAQVRGFSRSAVVITSVLTIAAACSFAAWSWYSSTQPTQNVVNIALQTPAITHAITRVLEPDKPISAVDPFRPRHERQKRVARQRQIERALTREAAMLSSWQSPTEKFMQSPTRFVLNSLPQLNQSVQDLQLFLPKNNELMKESNQ
jgi:hypothetical protein